SGLFMAATSLPMSACVNRLDQEDTDPQTTKNVNVILLVDTAKVNDFDKNKLGKYCRFTDQRQGMPIEDFTIYPNVGDTVTWIGLSRSSPTDEVYIRKVIRRSGTDVFDMPVLEDKDVPGKVTGKIITKTEEGLLDNEQVKKDYKYKLQFTVNNHPAVYNIDPKIQVNQ
ncbi:MAG: hypothetical protein OEW87_03570, partial [Flavobacteriaceae bacterium]|nr:hypothetical protein [Flavobacteriaceae bacterium]